jgi:hypothetical protein
MMPARGTVPPAEVDRAARGAPQLQVAADGWWERAQVASLPLPPGGVERLLEAPGATEVAVEVIWWGPPVVFVGAVVDRVARRSLRRIAARADWTPSEALDVLAGGPPGPPVRAELGAVNAWRSVGPLPLTVDADAAAIEAALAGRRDLARCHLPVALELVHESPRRAWWAIEVSARRAGRHHVRVERVAQLLRR